MLHLLIFFLIINILKVNSLKLKYYSCSYIHNPPGQPEGLVPDGGLQEGPQQGGEMAGEARHTVPIRH